MQQILQHVFYTVIIRKSETLIMKFENIYKETEENMRLALLSLWAPGGHPMRPAVEELFDREPLQAEPVFQSTFGWEGAPDDTWRKAIDADVWQRLENQRGATAEAAGRKFRPFVPFRHQAESWKALAEGRSIVVTAGTGSGKTECFMYPVLSDLYRQAQKRNTRAIEAIFLYPLNALMEDQKKRLSEYCRATGLSFAVYSGKTPEADVDGAGPVLANEVGTRREIRDAQTRPNILLTNPSMLEYILVRKQDQQMLQESAGRLRWIVIDEAHSYSGSAAVELAYQIKRILNAFGTTADQVRFACTSATIGGEKGDDSLKQFISLITGQPEERIQVIGGNRLVPNLGDGLAQQLQEDGLSTERVLALRKKINEVPALTLHQIWEWLHPVEAPYETLSALQLVDKLCEIGNGSVLSLRGHFFMRSISGLYACANEQCEGVNSTEPRYGHITTYKSSVCPHCGAPLLEFVQCKRCKSFVLMGNVDPQPPHKISPFDERYYVEDYNGLIPEEEEEEDELNNQGNTGTFFMLPYDRDRFFNPKDNAEFITETIDHRQDVSTLNACDADAAAWVEVQGARKSYCPSCGDNAYQKNRLKFRHFRIPINFINQTIAPAILHECAPHGSSWGKYIAFTDSRQGTAISAKMFNIEVERLQSYKGIVRRPAEAQNIPENVLQLLTEEQRELLSQGQNPELSLKEASEAIYDRFLSDHFTAGQAGEGKETAYRRTLLRSTIGRRSLYGMNAETMGLVYLHYPALQRVPLPNVLTDYADRNGVNVTIDDWQDFLKLCIDYCIRLGNHIQPIDGERQYVRESNYCTPIAAPDDQRAGVSHWPTIRRNADRVSGQQSRLVLLLCAGLGIHSLEQLQRNGRIVDAIMREAWNTLVNTRTLTRVLNNRQGYNDPLIPNYRNDRYVGCYYLDLSAGSKVCKIRRLGQARLCPVTHQLLDTTFCGYSPLIVGRVCPELFRKYQCSGELITLPASPRGDEDVAQWLEQDENVRCMKAHGLWTDRHKYVYSCDDAPYIAAEHSAQQSRELLRAYTEAFTQQPPLVNVLHCSTTMEMGVDIGDIDVVLMDTVPPTAANYLQRVGRAGRAGQSKAVAFSLCNNTPVGQQAFANSMWALESDNRKMSVFPSQTIIQRHVNSFFFREFLCKGENDEHGIRANMTIGEFMETSYKAFETFLDKMHTNEEMRLKFGSVFGNEAAYTIGCTLQAIQNLRAEYDAMVNELREAYENHLGDERRRRAIRIQRGKLESENLLSYISEHQFIPNANMPTGIVSFDFKDSDMVDKLHRLYDREDELRRQIRAENDEMLRDDLRDRLSGVRKNIRRLQNETTASRDIRTALSEYAPGQTVVVNEKNYVSAGVSFLGAYNQQTQTRGIYKCRHCGHTDYRPDLNEDLHCPICNHPYRGYLYKNQHYTLAYEPVGFCTDQHFNATREERTDKLYYNIDPVLLNVNWGEHTDVNLCEIFGSDETGNILYLNSSRGHGFAFCKQCGRAAVEESPSMDNSPIPPGHRKLWSGGIHGNDPCHADAQDIARHVVLVGNLPTCYSVLRFRKEVDSAEYEQDEGLAYSLGVVVRRALAKILGIDEQEIDFGTKKEQHFIALFIYDTAKGGCGYSQRLSDPELCQQAFDLARKTLDEAPCNCHEEGGACSRCLVDRNNYGRANLLSKAKALDWLGRQKLGHFEVPDTVREVSPDARPVYRSLKSILKKAVKDSVVTQISLFVSDASDDYIITDWTSMRSEMGRHMNKAISLGKEVRLFVEYHPERHRSLPDKLPFVRLSGKFSDCTVTFVQDMGNVKTALVVESEGGRRRYLVDDAAALSFSNNWGENGSHVFVDAQDVTVIEQNEPDYEEAPAQIVREGTTQATSFQVRNYFTQAIKPAVVRPQDEDMLWELLNGKHVDISYSDMYVNSALASLMLVYLIDEMKRLFGFNIHSVTLQLDSRRRSCSNDRFNDWTYISKNFPSSEEADDYTLQLFEGVLGIKPDLSPHDAEHPRWLRIETADGGYVEIRPDHSISGGYKSDMQYRMLDRLDGSVRVTRCDEDVLYYMIIERNDA